MKLNETFTEAELPKNESNFEPLPAGWYTSTIQGAELKQTKAGNGSYIAVKYAITGPTHQGRIVFANLNIRNPNPKAEEIGRAQLGELMRSIGLSKVEDTDQLIGGNLEIKLAIRVDEQYGNSNDVKGFKAIGGSAPTMPTPSAPSAPSGKATPPWAKK